MTAKRFGYIGLFSLFLIPFIPVAQTEPIITFYHGWLAAFFGLFVAVALLHRKEESSQTIPFILFLPLGLLLIIGFQTFTGTVLYTSQGVLACLSLGAGLLVMLGVEKLKSCFSVEQLINSIAIAILIASTFNALAGILQLLGVEPLFNILALPSTGSRIDGVLGQTNHLALLSTIGMLSALYLHNNKTLNIWKFALLATLFLIVLAASGSRSVWLYIGISAMTAFLLQRRAPSSDNRLLLYLLLGSLPLFFLTQELFSHLHTKELLSITTANERALAEGASATGGIGARLEVWPHAIAMFFETHLLGVGYGNFAWNNYLKVAENAGHIAENSDLHYTYFNNAHNIVLHLLAELGIWAGALMALGMGWLTTCTKRLEAAHHWWLWSVLAATGIHSLVEYPLWYLHFLLPFAALLALLNDQSFPVRLSSRLARPLLLSSLLAGSLLLGEVYLENAAINRLFLDQKRGSGQMADLATARRSGLLNAYVDDYTSRWEVRLGDPAALRQQLAVNDRLCRQRPTARILFRRVVMLFMAGRQKEALATLEVAAEVYRGRHLKRFVGYLDRAAKDYPQLQPLRRAVLNATIKKADQL